MKQQPLNVLLVSGVCEEMCTALLLGPSVQGPDSHRPPHDVEMRHLHFAFIVCKPRKIAWSGYWFLGKQILIWLS